MELYKLNWWKKSVRPEKSNDEYWDSMIHPQDLQIMEVGEFNGNIFRFIQSKDEFIQVTDGQKIIRIRESRKEDCLGKIDYEGFFIGDLVETKSLNKNNTYRQGLVCYMFYHHNELKIIYHIKDTEGKMIKKRYFFEDLQKIENTHNSK